MGKVLETRELYKDTLNEIRKDKDNWLSFLVTASWNFKYDFADQVFIYAQRPDATACAEMKVWNEKVHRWINKNANYIFVLSKDENSKYPFRLVFDVSDTHNFQNTKYKLWEVKPEYENELIESLENKFGEITNKENLAQAIKSSVYNMVIDNIIDYTSSIQKYKNNSPLEELEEQDIDAIMLQTVYSSVAFMMLHRCGINPNIYIEESEYSYINYFNNNELITILGTAISDIAEIGLREIAKTISNVQIKNKNINRTFVEKEKLKYNEEKNEGGNYEENRIHESGRLPNTKSSDGTRKDSKWKICKNEVRILKEGEESRINNIEDEQRVEQTFNRDSRNGNQDDKTNSKEDGRERWSYRRNESTRPDEMDRTNEQLQDDGRRTGRERTDIQLDLLTEEEQKQKIAEVQNTSAFSFTQEKINLDELEQVPKEISGNKEITDEYIKPKIKRERRNKIEYFDLHPEIAIEDRNNYKIINNELGEGTQKEKYQRNIQAIEVLKKCEQENRYATNEEQEILAQYVGWGGLAEAFDSNNSSWTNEYEELKNLLTEKEYKEARESTLTSFYTPPIVIKAIYKVLENMGLERGNILEPSCRSWKLYGYVT